MSVANGMFFSMDPNRARGRILPIRVMLFSCYLITGGFLCFIVSAIIAEMLDILTKRAKSTIEDKKLTSKSVSEWKQCFHLIDGLIREMNLCFGIILLIIVTFNCLLLIWLVNSSFFTFLELKELGHLSFNNALGVIFFIIATILITFIISILHSFREKVGFIYQPIKFQNV